MGFEDQGFWFTVSVLGLGFQKPGDSPREYLPCSQTPAEREYLSDKSEHLPESQGENLALNVV